MLKPDRKELRKIINRYEKIRHTLEQVINDVVSPEDALAENPDIVYELQDAFDLCDF